MGFWVLHPVYLCHFLIQDKVIIKSSSLWMSPSLDTRISSLLSYIYHYGENVNYDCQPIARFIDCFPNFLTNLVQNSCHIYI